MASIKALQTGAVQQEAGLTGGGQSPGWGESGSEESLGANDAFPWLTFGKGKSITHTQDNSITSNGFMDVPRQTMQHVERALSMHARFYGLDTFHYWMFGFENDPMDVVCFTLSTPSVEPTAGAVYEDGDENSLTFRRKEVNNSTTLYIFEGSTVESGQSGTLDKQSGTGDAELTFSAHSSVMYEHTYELDAVSRHFLAYTTAEQDLADYSAGDKKNRMVTLGIKMDTNDFRYKNAMCKRFGFSSTAGQLAEWSMDFLAYTEERGDYSSSSWTYPSTRIDSDGIIAHHQIKVELGTAEGSLTTLGVTNVDLSCEIPLQVIQDTTSGLYIAEPVIEGKYSCDSNIILSRYSADTYLDLIDAWTSVVARYSSAYGYYRSEFLIQEAKIESGGPDDSEVAKENLHLVPGAQSSNNWSTWLSGVTLLQSSPIVYRCRNDVSTNMMFLI